MDIRKIINDRIETKRISRTQLAQKLGWDRANLLKYLRGPGRIRSDRLAQLLRWLDLEIKPTKGEVHINQILDPRPGRRPRVQR
jgi:transcriptional regulator with XRE-family HTH domain